MSISRLILTLTVSIYSICAMNQKSFSRSIVMEKVKEKIKLAPIAPQNTDDILKFIHEQDPQNHALQAYVILRTVLEKSPQLFDRNIFLEFQNKFKAIKMDAEKVNSKEGKDVSIVLEHYLNYGGSKICRAVDINSLEALSFLIAMGENVSHGALAIAAEKQNIKAIEILLAAGCPAHDPDDPPQKQAIFFALAKKNEELFKTLIPHVNLSIGFDLLSRKVTLKEYLESTHPYNTATYASERALLQEYYLQKLP